MKLLIGKHIRSSRRIRSAGLTGLLVTSVLALGLVAASSSSATAASSSTGRTDQPRSLISQEPGWRGNATPAPAGTHWTVAVVPKSVGLFFWGTVDAGAQAAGKYFHVKIIWKGTSSETDVTGQVNMLQDFISRHVSGIAFAATDAHGLVSTAKAATRAGIPVVNIDSGLSPQTPPLVASHNIVAGAKAADILAKLIGDKGQVALLPFVPSAETSIQRQQGFETELKKYPGVKLVAVRYDESNIETALSITDDILTAHPDLKGIFDANEPGVDGTVSALAGRGLTPGTVKVVGFDNAVDEVNDLADGYVSALIVQNPFRIGYQGVAEVVSLLEHRTVPHSVDTGVIVATKANMNQPDVHQRLFPPTLGP
jgi:ribose transport system substrate-binding protein